MKLKYAFETVKLDNQTIVVPVGEAASELHGVIKLNDSASRIFQLIEQGKSETEIVSILTGLYEESPQEQVQEYVHFMVELLLEKGLLEIT